MAVLIGIDLGSHSVKAAVFGRSGRKLLLVAQHARPVPQDGSAPPSLEVRLDALGALLADDVLAKGRPTCFAAFPAEAASVRFVDLPFSDKARLEKVLPFEVEGMVPFDLDLMVLVSRILGPCENGTRVMAVLAEKARLAPLLQGLAGAGADPKALMLDGLALADAAGSAPSGVVSAVVDVGHVRTLVTLVQGGRALGTRALDTGGLALTRAIASALSLSYEDAEARKHRTSIYAEGAADPDDARARRALQEGLVPLLGQLRTALVAFEDAHGVEVDEVVLCGGSAALEGLPAWLGQVLGVPVRRALTGDENDGRFALATSLVTAASRAHTVDFRVGELAFKGDLATVRAVAGVGAAGLAAFCAAGVLLFGVRMIQYHHQLATLDENIAAAVLTSFPDVDPEKVKDADLALAIMQEKTNETRVRVEALGAITGEAPPTVELLRDLTEARPPPAEARLDTQELTITEAAITLKAETDGYEAAAKIESSIQAVAQFKDAKKGEERKVREGVRFTITIPVGTEGAATDGAAAAEPEGE